MKEKTLGYKIPSLIKIPYLQRKPKKTIPLLAFSEDILYEIYECLPLVDQACLALSCKRLLSLFGKGLKQEEFAFPHLLRSRAPILCVNSAEVVRNQLLLRLETDTSAYCGRCLKLHPRHEFSPEPSSPKKRGWWRKSKNKTTTIQTSQALEKSCTVYAGILDICPCTSLTLRGRGRIIDLLQSPSTPLQTRYGLSSPKPDIYHHTQESYRLQILWTMSYYDRQKH
ncbi:hypothetical protein ASPZODRAFT_322728 [Penicilliopsis zonata CBS 506.65]|uniref:F-box domain-containing protein n=1 Tax=Penicilliopsis zonata CBS 506.65 TaxID=1073090 RepID=A0A1L9SV75_9EURO|nr:hypothetical protein ASPZODRAFT_322728 [Penicilliopsis zonata CBS 506.65]OJJ51132.1 hypothetical protein ASPZODRAFT_322728 [Penicilliopsis zonata CBS 506.65]